MSRTRFRLPGLTLTDHEFEVPLDHTRPDDGRTIRVFAREVVRAGSEKADLPWLVFLQGGPGFESPRPTDRGSWLGVAVESYRVLLLDQRGTGRSTPVGHRTLAGLDSPAEQAEYLTHFRADSIVRDLELIRRELLGEGTRWTMLGQSYGGFCSTTYLSLAPEALDACIVTGGLPPLDAPIDEIYRATYRRVLDRNRRYYERYPGDEQLVRDVVRHLEDNDVRLPSDSRLSPRQVQQLGLGFGMSDGFEPVHYLLEQAFVDGPEGAELSDAFLHGFEATVPYLLHPIFSILHEAAYCHGSASNWSAQRVRAEHPELEADSGRRVLFTGEMIYPWMFDEYRYLQPLREAAEILAAKDDWPALYDIDRLAGNEVPVVAAVYLDDMYVEHEFSADAAKRIGNVRAWVTNEFDHNGLRTFGDRVLPRLLGMLRGDC